MSEVLTLEAPVKLADASPAMPSHRTTPAAVWWAVVFAFVLRYGWVLVAHKYRFTLPTHYDFGQEMGAVARSIATGHGFSSPFPEWSGPTTWMAPLYPTLMAAVFKLFGLYSTASALVMLGLNSAFSALTCLPIYLLGRELTNRRVALVSTWLWALVPQFMTWAIDWVWDAALTGLVLICLVLMATRMARHATLGRWLGFGALWGLASLLNPTVLSVFPFAVLYVVWQRPSRWEALRALSCVLTLVLVTTPWLIRNYNTFGKFIFIRGNFWFELRLGNSIWGDGTEMLFTHPEVNQFERIKYIKMGEQAYFETKKRDVVAFIHEYPSFFAQLCFRRVLLFWWDYDDFLGDIPDALMAIGRRTFSTLAFVGMVFLLLKRRPGALLITATLCVFPAVFYLTTPSIRYRHVIEPILLICVVYALSQVKEFRRLFSEADSSVAADV